MPPLQLRVILKPEQSFAALALIYPVSAQHCSHVCRAFVLPGAIHRKPGHTQRIFQPIQGGAQLI